MKNKKGFTLIELLAVIVILAIIALIAAPIVLNMINSAKKNAAKTSALYYMEAVEKTISLRDLNNKPVKSGVYEINGDLLTRKTEDSDSQEDDIIKVLVRGELPAEGEININGNQKIVEATLYINNYKAIYDGNEITSLEKSGSLSITSTHSIGSTIEKDSIHQLLEETILKDGNYTLKLTDGTEIPFEIYTFNQDVNYNKNQQLCDNVKDNKMCILKYKKNLTINNDITVTPQVRKKGFVVYVEGTLTNNGTISMTARGAKAEGQNVVLYKNNDNTYETVPAVGGTGAANVTAFADISNGKTGVSGNLRSTGGGVSGAASSYSTSSRVYSGLGGAGTSYSGGTGGGGVYTGHYSATAQNGAANGGSGGDGAATTYRGDDSNVWTATGGAGNDGGLGYYGYNTVVTQDNTYNGNSGTGGLLIIYSNYIINNGLIDANGVDSYKQSAAAAPGGSSGGGSVNIFYKENYTNSGTVQANGGASVKGSVTGYWFTTGGAGGNGTVTIGSIKTGTFVKN